MDNVNCYCYFLQISAAILCRFVCYINVDEGCAAMIAPTGTTTTTGTNNTTITHVCKLPSYVHMTYIIILNFDVQLHSNLNQLIRNSTTLF